MDKNVPHYLEELGMNPNEIKVYIAMAELGEAPASRVAKKANLPRTTAISILEKFKRDGVISTHKYKGVTYFWIESPRVLSESFLAKADIATELSSLFSGLYRSEALFPFAEIHDTKHSIRKFIEKTIANLEPKSVIYTFDTPREGNYSKIYSESIENVITARKTKRGILTQTLVPNGVLKEIPAEKIKEQSIVIRELPPGISFRASIWIIGDTVVHFSGNPPFAVALMHKEIAHGMKSVFDFFWKAGGVGVR